MEKGMIKQPLYNQLVDLLKEKIEMEMEANDMLPSERELTNRYGLSRTTVRLALQELEKQGYIYRQHGKGTFVSDLSKQVTNLSGSYSFTEQMRSVGKTPETKILEFEVVEANKYLAGRLGVSLGEKLLKLKRLRLADGQPMMLERSYLPAKKFLTLTRELLEQKPLYDLFSQEFNQTIRVANEEFFATIAKSKDARQLQIIEGSPVVSLRRTTYITEN